MSVIFLSELMNEIGQRGRNLLSWHREHPTDPADLCEILVSRRGEVSSFALSEAILESWERLEAKDRVRFLVTIAQRFGPDAEAILDAIATLGAEPDADALYRLHRVSEPRTQELLRRLNMADGGTRRLVRMREAVIEAIAQHPILRNLDGDFFHLFSSWFNRGFLELKPINWSTPASILEKFIEYEAVHEINGWDDLRSRIEPGDRRLFAFFHPRMDDEPLIFVEVALTGAVPDNIGSLLATSRKEIAPGEATTAVFYSISNCQKGLRGISFGNLLIKQVVEHLRSELPNLRSFVTLSPMPGFRPWLDRMLADGSRMPLPPEDMEAIAAMATGGWPEDAESRRSLGTLLQGIASYYLIEVRDERNRVVDPVARFHLGNGARLENIHPFADLSGKGELGSYGVMVNYRYTMPEVEANHEAYAERGTVIASAAARNHLRRFLAQANKLRAACRDLCG